MKHLRKDDGYVMVYVLIAFTILALVAGSICAMALNNLKAQKADVARMEARYAAEGELQKFVAAVEALGNQTPPIQEERGSKEDAEAAIKEAFLNAANGLENNATLSVVEDASDEGKLVIKASSQNGAVEIDAELLIDLDNDINGVGELISEDPPRYNSYQSVLKKVEVSGYHSYEVSYQTADENAGEGDAG